MRHFIILLTTVLVFSAHILSGQKIEPQALSSAGEHMKSGNINLDWTLGENAVETIGDNQNKLTQGFQQGEMNFTTSVFAVNNDISIRVFPNPTSDILYIESSDNMVDLSARITTASGVQLMFINQIDEGISLSNMQQGYYILSLESRGQQIYYAGILKL